MNGVCSHGLGALWSRSRLNRFMLASGIGVTVAPCFVVQVHMKVRSGKILSTRVLLRTYALRWLWSTWPTGNHRTRSYWDHPHAMVPR